MRICRFEDGAKEAYGVIEDESVYRLIGSPFADIELGSIVGPLSGVKLLAPVTPSKILGVGPNYPGMADDVLLEHPRIFGRGPNTVVGPDDEIYLPVGMNVLVYEGELGVVIGRRAKMVSEEECFEYVMGYMLGNDVTSLETMEADGGQLCRAKGFDTFYPCGPWVETDLDPEKVVINVTKNGITYSGISLENAIFNIPTLIAFISSTMTLEPGDVITTGCAPTVFGEMIPGDEITVSAEGLGKLNNTLVAA
jgi:2-keto-4-pentenoate hydratase/2-oxohepta-3-ene-1,7-dioic acid hydratase in catechol pathway